MTTHIETTEVHNDPMITQTKSSIAQTKASFINNI